jgi:hypothetical protein
MAGSKYKGSKYTEGFTGIVHSVFESPAFVALSPHACKLLLELAGQYRGNNNGNLTVAWSVVKNRGWKSRTTLWRCKAELIEAGFVYVTRKGHMPSTCELLALTWFALDVSPKFDPEALAVMASDGGNIQSTTTPPIEGDAQGLIYSHHFSSSITIFSSSTLLNLYGFQRMDRTLVIFSMHKRWRK